MPRLVLLTMKCMIALGTCGQEGTTAGGWRGAQTQRGRETDTGGNIIQSGDSEAGSTGTGNVPGQRGTMVLLVIGTHCNTAAAESLHRLQHSQPPYP